MAELEKYTSLFVDVFETTKQKATTMKYQDDKWDSVGHMMLLAAIEDTYGIELATEDIVNFNSFEEGIKILKKYGINI